MPLVEYITHFKWYMLSCRNAAGYMVRQRLGTSALARHRVAKL